MESDAEANRNAVEADDLERRDEIHCFGAGFIAEDAQTSPNPTRVEADKVRRGV